jgi:hypothetical protein
MAESPKKPNLGDLLGHEGMEVEGKLDFQRAETPAERTARIAREDADAAHERWKEKFLLIAITAIVGVSMVLCFVILLVPSFPEDSRKLAGVILTAVISAALGRLSARPPKSL